MENQITLEQATNNLAGVLRTVRLTQDEHAMMTASLQKLVTLAQRGLSVDDTPKVDSTVVIPPPVPPSVTS